MIKLDKTIVFFSENPPLNIYDGVEWGRDEDGRIYSPNIEEKVWQCGTYKVPMLQDTIFRHPDTKDLYKLKGKYWTIIRFHKHE